MGRKLIATVDAAVAEKQHKTPCSDCPFLRTSLCGWLGGHAIEDFLAAARSDDDSGCHAIVNAAGEAMVCAGMAIYRANVGKLPRSPATLRLPADRKTVFSSPVEFTEHHREIKKPQ